MTGIEDSAAAEGHAAESVARGPFWALGAILKRRAGTPFHPAGKLRPEPMAGHWRSQGFDSYFYVPMRCRAGLLRVRFEATILDAGTDHRDRWRLYFDIGEGFREEDSLVIDCRGPRIEIETMIDLPAPVRAFRIDPCERSGRFVLHKLALTAPAPALPLANGALHRIAELHRRRALLRAAMTGARLVLRGDWRVLRQRIVSGAGTDAAGYHRWVRSRTMTPALRQRFVARSQRFKLRPRFSIIMPTYNSPPVYLVKALESVRAQTYPDWELLAVDDGSTDLSALAILRDFAARDPRIRPTFLPANGGIAAASNVALEQASGDYIALLDHDDELAPHALHAFADAINRAPQADWLYSDEDKIDEAGHRSSPFFKPDWSPAYFLSCMYSCHLGVYRTSLARRLGGFRSEYDFAQDYDLALRFAASTAHIVHVPDILYHWRMLPQSTASGSEAKPQAELAARRAVQDFVDRGSHSGKVEAGPVPGTHRVRFAIAGKPLVSIAIPTAGYRNEAHGGGWYVLDLVRSIRERTTYPDIEIVVSENGDLAPELTQALLELGVRLVRYESGEFNLSDKINRLAGATRGDYLLLLNDDMRIISPGWIEEMLMWCQQDGVSGVGAKLFFPDGRIQHAGVLLLGQGPSHPYYLHHGSEIGQVCSAIVPRDYSAVTGACMMVRRADFLAVGGFDPAYRINYNDVDFCMRLNAWTGGHFVFTPYACLEHYESVSRPEPVRGDLDKINRQWSAIVGRDPFYNLNLSQNSACFALAADPRSLQETYGL
ncbi:glycosyltransferase family 2 protein [Bosea sp. NPDC055332]